MSAKLLFLNLVSAPNDMKRITIAYLIFIPLLSFSHNIQQEVLWKACPVKTLEGEELKMRHQGFVKVNENTVFWFRFQELLSMESGEVHIETSIDTFHISPTKSNSAFTLKGQNSSRELQLHLSSKSTDEFQLVSSKHIFTFQKVKGTGPLPLKAQQVREFVVGNTFIEYDKNASEVVGRFWKTYQANGKAKYKQIGSSSQWESSYLIVDFAGFIFLKGITSAPILLLSIENGMLNGLRFDDQDNPEKICLANSKQIAPFKVYENSSTKPFEIEVAKISAEECAASLTPEQLSFEMSVHRGISEKEFTVNQVQHSYGCSWNLFNENGKARFEKASVEKLISLDPTLCLVVDIPCGYYAERKNKNDEWYIYLHEERLETDSSFVLKKAFLWDNTYRVINELKTGDVIHYEDYYLDTRIIRKTWTYKNGVKTGITRNYDEMGRLVNEVKHD